MKPIADHKTQTSMIEQLTSTTMFQYKQDGGMIAMQPEIPRHNHHNIHSKFVLAKRSMTLSLSIMEEVPFNEDENSIIGGNIVSASR